jgi:hypothetical protein
MNEKRIEKKGETKRLLKGDREGHSQTNRQRERETHKYSHTRKQT